MAIGIPAQCIPRIPKSRNEDHQFVSLELYEWVTSISSSIAPYDFMVNGCRISLWCNLRHRNIVHSLEDKQLCKIEESFSSETIMKFFMSNIAYLRQSKMNECNCIFLEQFHYNFWFISNASDSVNIFLTNECASGRIHNLQRETFWWRMFLGFPWKFLASIVLLWGRYFHDKI